MSLPPLRAADKTAGQDVFLEYRRHAKFSWSGSARHPAGTAVPIHVKSNPPSDFSAAPDGLSNASRPHSKLRARSPLSEEFCAGNAALVPASARNRPPFTCMHSYADAQKSSGAFLRDMGRERCRKRPGRVRIALRGSPGVRARGVMVNKPQWWLKTKHLRCSGVS